MMTWMTALSGMAVADVKVSQDGQTTCCVENDYLQLTFRPAEGDHLQGAVAKRIKTALRSA